MRLPILALLAMLIAVLVWVPQVASDTTTAKIEGRIWYDDNGNGLLDPGEELISGATVSLSNSSATVVYGVTKSDTNGIYQFSLVSPGDYTLWASAPTQVAGNAAVKVQAGQIVVVDFPTIRQPVLTPSPQGTITGTVFYDRNGNRVLDPGEEKISTGLLQWFRPGETSTPITRKYLDGSTFTISVAPGTWGIRVISLDSERRQLVGEVNAEVATNSIVVANIGLKLIPLPLADFDIPTGHFYSQARGPAAPGAGYSITNDSVAPFWDEFQRLGGVDAVGYPASRRFVWDGFTSQVMQKEVFQWRPEVGRVYFVNVFDELSNAGKDDWLLAFRQVPKPFDNAPDAGQPWDRVVERHLAYLDQDPAIKARYLSDPDWLNHYGLPQSYGDFGNVFVIRAQRAVFQRWKVDVPWARPGEVTIANGGDIAKEAGLIPKEATVPEPPPIS